MARRSSLLSCLVSLIAFAGCGAHAETPSSDGGSPDGAVNGIDAGVSSEDGGTSNADGASPHGDSGAGAGDAAACVIKPPQTEHLPHVSAGGDPAIQVKAAFDAIFAGQTPPISASSYAMSSVDCENVDTPMSNSHGYSCQITVQVAGSPVNVKTAQPSPLANDLVTALQNAGAKPCNDIAHGMFARLQNVSVSGSSVEFDDGSNYALPFPPNITAHDADATSILDAFTAGGIQACDPARELFLVCNTLQSPSGAPSCGYSWSKLENVSGSYLAYVCMGTPVEAGPSLTDSASAAMWSAISNAAAHAGFTPSRGTVAQATVINARAFAFDGTSLTFNLTMDNPGLPPTPNH